MTLTNALKIFIDNGNHSTPYLDILRSENDLMKYLCIGANWHKYYPNYVKESKCFYDTQIFIFIKLPFA
jgi:hypothetical protein